MRFQMRIQDSNQPAAAQAPDFATVEQAQDRQKSHNPPSRAPDKPTPETKIVYALTRKRFLAPKMA